MRHGVIGRTAFDAVLPEHGPGWAVAAALIATVASAAVVHILFERPVLAFGQRLAGGLRTGVTRTAPARTASAP